MRKILSNLNKKASITYETALTLPLFMGILIFFLSFYQLLMIQEVLSSAAYNAAEEASMYGFVFQNDESEEENETELSDIDTEEELQLFVINNLQQIAGRIAGAAYFSYRIGLMLPGNLINDSFIKGGFDGISFYDSEVLSDNKVIIKMKYYFIIPIFEKLVPPVEVRQSITVRSFTGHYVAKKGEEKNTDEEMVYIAETGQVYHTNRDCTYIKLFIREVAYSDINSLISKGGGKYSECNICAGQGVSNNKVYVTDYGDRYHVNLQCHGIKRSITAIKLSDIGDRRLCSKCAKNQTVDD